MEGSEYPRAWNFADDGELDGRYVATKQVTTRDGRDMGLVELKLVDTNEPVVVWLSAAVLKDKFATELRKRIRQGQDDFHPGERMRIRRGGTKQQSASGNEYWPFEIEFEHAASAPTAKEILLAGETEQGGDVDEGDIPF